MIPHVKHRVVAKTVAYQIDQQKDRSGTLFTNRGASASVTFTLPPTPRACRGWEYTFIGVADQNIVVAAKTADTLLVLNDAAADTLSLSTASQKIGGMIRAFCDGNQWLVFTGSVGATGTVAT